MKKYENNTNCYIKTFTRRFIMKLCTRGFTAETIGRNRYVNNSRMFMKKHILMMAAGWAPPYTRQLSNRILNLERCRWAGECLTMFYFHVRSNFNFNLLTRVSLRKSLALRTNIRNGNTTVKTIPSYNSIRWGISERGQTNDGLSILNVRGNSFFSLISLPQFA